MPNLYYVMQMQHIMSILATIIYDRYMVDDKMDG